MQNKKSIEEYTTKLFEGNKQISCCYLVILDHSVKTYGSSSIVQANTQTIVLATTSFQCILKKVHNNFAICKGTIMIINI